ncbi:MAG TPA: hypothetical protein DEQ34_13780 [Balneolaceae bacterium]|nr:hypothetical protein [Balneolaceae bacterium]|tara:strand:+ start:25556 stop:26800 length:1245 start_codon:yes stop_codon:yes gene_type:complete
MYTFNKPIHTLFLLVFLLLPESTSILAQEVTWKGFVSSESYFDSKEAVASREADVLLYPKRPVFDNLNNDQTDIRSFHMVSFNSRLQAKASDFEAFGATSSAVIEIDFLGTGENYVNMIRMRHAFVKLKWEKSTVLMGQYWHPMFITSSYPEVLGWGGAAPVNVLSRNPQVRFTYDFNSRFSANISALSHRDFTSNGPDGYSSKYIRNSGLPELNLQMQYSLPNVTGGFTIGTKSIKPCISTPSGNMLNETLQSWQSNVYVKLNTSLITAKVVGIYGQNLTNLLMIGGYAERTVEPDMITYTNLLTSSYWTEISTNGETVQAALFAGVSVNHGASEELALTDGTLTANIYGRGTDIASLYRVAPRITFKNGPLLWGFEFTWSAANYGTPDSFGNVIDTELAHMYRMQLAAKYTF